MHAVEEKLDHDSHIYKYLLTLEPTEMSDAAEYTCQVGTRSTSAKLIVDEGRRLVANIKPSFIFCMILPFILRVFHHLYLYS